MAGLILSHVVVHEIQIACERRRIASCAVGGRTSATDKSAEARSAKLIDVRIEASDIGNDYPLYLGVAADVKQVALDLVAAMERCAVREAALLLQQWFGVGRPSARRWSGPSGRGERERELVRKKK